MQHCSKPKWCKTVQFYKANNPPTSTQSDKAWLCFSCKNTTKSRTNSNTTKWLLLKVKVEFKLSLKWMSNCSTVSTDWRLMWTKSPLLAEQQTSKGQNRQQHHMNKNSYDRNFKTTTDCFLQEKKKSIKYAAASAVLRHHKELCLDFGFSALSKRQNVVLALMHRITSANKCAFINVLIERKKGGFKCLIDLKYNYSAP